MLGFCDRLESLPLGDHKVSLAPEVSTIGHNTGLDIGHFRRSTPGGQACDGGQYANLQIGWQVT